MLKNINVGNMLLSIAMFLMTLLAFLVIAVTQHIFVTILTGILFTLLNILMLMTV